MSESPLPKKGQILLLSFLTTIFFVNCLSRIILGPLLPVIEKDLGLSHAGAGALFIMVALGYSMGLFGSGFISSRLAYRRTVVLAGIIVGGALLLISGSRTFWTIRGGLFLLGVASGIYLPSGMTMITTSIAHANWGKAIAVHELAPTMAYITAPLIVEGLLLFWPWQGVLILIGSVAALLAVNFLRFGRGGEDRGQAPTFGNIRFLLVKPVFWIMTILFCLGVGFTIGLYSMIPLYLVAERGIDRSLANTVVGLSRIPVFGMALLAGWISDRFGPKPTMAAALFFTGCLTILLGALPGRWVILIVILQPMLTVCFFPPGFSILSRNAPPESRNLSVSLTMFIAYLTGAGLIPAGLGIFGDAGVFGWGFILIGVLILASVLLVLRLNLDGLEKA